MNYILCIIFFSINISNCFCLEKVICYPKTASIILGTYLGISYYKKYQLFNSKKNN
jgi:hypothetical protein